MKHSNLPAILFLSVIFMAGCKSQYDLLLEGNDAEAKYKAAFEYFENGKYNRAAALFESLSIIASGTERDDTVQYYWGLSNYSDRDYVSAQANFERFISNFPSSPFTQQARFLRIDCLYKSTYRYELDQTPTYTALTAMSEYLIENPSDMNAEVIRRMIAELNERLDRKAFENARIYYTMEDYKAARVALKNVLKDDAENIYREDILYYTAMASYKFAALSVEAKKRERFLVFLDDYYNFVGEYPESSYRKELDHLFKKVKEDQK